MYTSYSAIEILHIDTFIKKLRTITMGDHLVNYTNYKYGQKQIPREERKSKETMMYSSKILHSLNNLQFSGSE